MQEIPLFDHRPLVVLAAQSNSREGVFSAKTQVIEKASFFETAQQLKTASKMVTLGKSQPSLIKLLIVKISVMVTLYNIATVMKRVCHKENGRSTINTAFVERP